MAPRPPGADPGSAAESTAAPTRAVWLLVGTIAAAKLVTIVVILWASRSTEAGALVAATTWPWLLPVAALVGGPLLFRLRLRRVRAKRARLLRAEWLLPDEPAHDSATRRAWGIPAARRPGPNPSPSHDR